MFCDPLRINLLNSCMLPFSVMNVVSVKLLVLVLVCLWCCLLWCCSLLSFVGVCRHCCLFRLFGLCFVR